MRKQPSQPPDITPTQPKSVITQVREYKLITPLYGGGVAPDEADPVTVIRATEVRGHLRFWWRACRGGQKKFNANLAEMKKEEDSIWGAAYKKGETAIRQEQTIQIVVETEALKEGKDVEPFPVREVEREDGRKELQSRPDRRTGIPAYAAFPLQLSQEDLQKPDPRSKKVRDAVSFTLTISFPAQREVDVKAALWAWEIFGGIGARTRRGFGALRCISIQENDKPVAVDLPPNQQEAAIQWLQSNLAHYVVDGSYPNAVPHLNSKGIHGTHFKVVSERNNRDPFALWNNLIDRLKNFRQQRSQANRPNANNPGRSKWPEPSNIRQLSRQSLPTHATPIPNPPIRKFPRAVFGLPIIFQFKDNRNRLNPGAPQSDPRKTVLQLKTSERFASPLILKPVACPQDTFVGLALLLEGTGIGKEQLQLKTQEGIKEEWDVEADLDPGETLVIANPGSAITIDSKTNALQAFLKYL